MCPLSKSVSGISATMRRFGSSRFALSQAGSTSQGAALGAAVATAAVACDESAEVTTSVVAVQMPKLAAKINARIASNVTPMIPNLGSSSVRCRTRLNCRRLLVQRFNLLLQVRNVHAHGVPDNLVVD